MLKKKFYTILLWNDIKEKAGVENQWLSLF